MIFLPNGVMAVQVVSSPELRPARADTEAQKAKALDTYTAFYGRYELHPDLGTVVLIFDQSVDPNLKGLIGDRRYSFDGDLLIMRFHTQPGAPETTNFYRRIP